MQNIRFPMQHLNITQAYGSGTHVYGYPVDNAGKDAGIDGVLAPFDAVVKKKWANGHTVWLESIAKVKFADGTVDYATVMLTHDNDISDLTVDQQLKQGQLFYQEGTAGQATGNHIHLEVGRGKFTGEGWNQQGNQWVINNPYKPEKAFFIPSGTTIIKTGGLSWTKENIMQRTAFRRLIRAMLNRDATAADEKLYLGKDPNAVIIKIDDWARENNRTYQQTVARKDAEIAALKAQLASAGGIDAETKAQITETNSIVKWLKEKIGGIFK